MQAGLATLVQAAYTAFETLVTGSWIAAVNDNTLLATNFSNKHPSKAPNLAVWSSYGFDASKYMGRMLYENNVIKFEPKKVFEHLIQRLSRGSWTTYLRPTGV